MSAWKDGCLWLPVSLKAGDLEGGSQVALSRNSVALLLGQDEGYYRR